MSYAGYTVEGRRSRGIKLSRRLHRRWLNVRGGVFATRLIRLCTVGHGQARDR